MGNLQRLWLHIEMCGLGIYKAPCRALALGLPRMSLEQFALQVLLEPNSSDGGFQP